MVPLRLMTTGSSTCIANWIEMDVGGSSGNENGNVKVNNLQCCAKNWPVEYR